MPTEFCSECHVNVVERGHYVCADCEAVIAAQGVADERDSKKRRGAAGPALRGKGVITQAGPRWRFSPLFIALVAVVIWSCNMAWQTYEHPTYMHGSIPAWLEQMAKVVSDNAHRVINSMK